MFQKICTEQGGYLTVIESTDENEVLKGHIASYGKIKKKKNKKITNVENILYNQIDKQSIVSDF